MEASIAHCGKNLTIPTAFSANSNYVGERLEEETSAKSVKTSEAKSLVHRKKSFSLFLSSVGISLTKLSLGGNNDVIYKLFPPREGLVSDIPAGDGNIEKLFLRYRHRVAHGTCVGVDIR
jgi:hypothetical protein